MKYPASIIIAILEQMSYDSWITITGFPVCVTHREDLINGLVDVGFIFKEGERYGLTPLGQQFLNNANSDSTI